MHRPIAIALSCFFVAACARDAAPTEGDEGMPAAAPVQQPEAASAVAVLARGGDFRFALADSGVAANVRLKCEAEGAEKVERCIDEAIASAAEEGVELSDAGDGQLRFVSYGHEDGKRVVYLEALIAVEDAGDGIVEIHPQRVVTGPELPEGARLFIEVVDESTIAMDKKPGAHPRTGGERLVYHRLGS